MKYDRKKVFDVIGKTNVHVDFHTPPYQREVGKDFNGDRFGKMLKSANIDSISFFGKDYHGMSFYNTKYGTKHPNMENDMLKEAIEGCHKHEVKVIVYYALGLDAEIVKQHPEWTQVDMEGIKHGSCENNNVGWVCFNSPYTEEIFIPQITEVMESYNIDGFFFDELFYYEKACVCPFCKSNMKKLGLDYTNAEDVTFYRAKSCDIFAERITKIVNDYNEDLVVLYNPTTNIVGIMDNLVPHENVINVGGHETGWGYINMPMEARHVRNYDLPILGMTGIFHRRWGDFGTVKHEAQLRYELAEMLSHHFVVSIGDHMRPRGVLEQAKYDVIGEAFKYAKSLNLPVEAKPAKDIAIVTPGVYDSAMYIEGRSDSHTFEWPIADGLSGSAKILLDTHQQFDIITERQALDVINEFNLLIIPEAGALQSQTAEAIKKFVAEGGSLLVTGNSSFDKGEFSLGEVLGIRYLSEGPYDKSSSVYLRLNDYNEGLADGIDFKAYSGYIQVIVRDNAEVKAGIVGPSAGGRHYASLYKGGPAERLLESPGIVYNRYGKGQAVYIACDLFTAYYEYAYYGHKRLLNNIITSLQEKRLLDCDGSANVRVNAMIANEGMFVHIVNYYPEDGGSTIPRINCWPPAIDVTLKVFEPKATEVTAVTNAKYKALFKDGYVEVKLYGISLYEVLIIK